MSTMSTIRMIGAYGSEAAYIDLRRSGDMSDSRDRLVHALREFADMLEARRAKPDGSMIEADEVLDDE